MADAEPRRPHTVHGLLSEMQDFISDNRSSREVALRWLSAYLAENITKILSAVRNDRLGDEHKKMVADFRLSEIEAEKEKREKEIAALDREASELKG